MKGFFDAQPEKAEECNPVNLELLQQYLKKNLGYTLCFV